MTIRPLLLACAALATSPALAATTDVLIGLDSKIGYTDQGQVNVEPGTDKVVILDVSTPGAPRIRASLDLANSLVGPPTNLGITPDGRLGLVANSVVHVRDGAAWKAQPDTKLFVIDLEASPPKLLDTLTVGRQPSGLDIARSGKLALIANRAGKSVSVLSIEGTAVKHLAEIDLGQEAAAVAISPDGRKALAVLNLANKVAVLSIDGTAVTYDKADDIPVAFFPYNVVMMPDGKHAVVSNTGGGKDNADALVTIELGPHPHVVALTSVGVGPEGLAVSPDGKWLATPLLRGSSAKQADYFYTRDGEAVLATMESDGRIAVKARAPLGALPEGLAFSADSQYVYIADYIDKTLRTFHLAGDKFEPVGAPMMLPGQPASMRGVTR